MIGCTIADRTASNSRPNVAACIAACRAWAAVAESQSAYGVAIAAIAADAGPSQALPTSPAVIAPNDVAAKSNS
ncbi:hypothetical protein LAUMK41_02807 [Mycobacterium attenuatum]|nr:hypothetical protein LAUMK41_02807 [Mycobacterium attenuatum]